MKNSDCMIIYITMHDGDLDGFNDDYFKVIRCDVMVFFSCDLNAIYNVVIYNILHILYGLLKLL